MLVLHRMSDRLALQGKRASPSAAELKEASNVSVKEAGRLPAPSGSLAQASGGDGVLAGHRNTWWRSAPVSPLVCDRSCQATSISQCP